MKHPDNQYTTLSCAIEALKKKGYTHQLMLTERLVQQRRCTAPLTLHHRSLPPVQRAERPSGHWRRVCAVRSEELGPNGVLVGDCGANAQNFIHKMVSALPAHEHADPMGRVLDAQGWTVEFMKRDKLRNPSDLHTSTAGKSVQYHLDAA